MLYEERYWVFENSVLKGRGVKENFPYFLKFRPSPLLPIINVISLRPSLINSLFLVRGMVGFDLFRKKKKTKKLIKRLFLVLARVRFAGIFKKIRVLFCRHAVKQGFFVYLLNDII